MENNAQHGWLVACLCAAWCSSCREYRATFAEVARQQPDKRFVWVDIENFPTVLVALGDELRFLGTLLPQTATLERMLDAASRNVLASMVVAQPATLVACVREIGERVG